MNVVLGVSGSIAAYKACEIVRALVKDGCDVRVIITAAAMEFVTPLTFQTLSRNPVGVDQFALPERWQPEHISLAQADVLVVAPATANVIAKMACGIADDLLTSTILATKAPVVIAPAMNSGMWENKATQANVATLMSRGISVVSPASGELACGTTGRGRMADVADVLAAVRKVAS